MLDIPSRRGPFHDHLVFFARAEEVQRLADGRGTRDVFRFRHAQSDATVPRALHDGTSYTTCVDLRPARDELLRGFDAKSCRYELRKAEKLGDRVGISCDEARTARDFEVLYNEFVARSGHAGPMRRRRLDRYLGVGNVFVAYLDEVPIVGHVLIVDRSAGRVRLVFSASTRLDSERRRADIGPVNRWLHWHEMLRYRDHGLTTYDFGGVNPTSPAARFKLSFGGRFEVGINLTVAGSSRRRVQ